LRPERVAVVGAGMAGLATAWFLQERGVRVTVLERERLTLGYSWGNAGWISPALTTPLPEPAVLGYGVRAALNPASPSTSPAPPRGSCVSSWGRPQLHGPALAGPHERLRADEPAGP
jgi:choline dehydrogenase-like flavoprotein